MLSHRFRSIFVHVPKTAGQSIEMLFLAAHDLTWRTRSDLLLRPAARGSAGPRRLSHLYAREYVALGHVSAEDFQSYFKFALVRDPYARLVSEYRYRKAWQSQSFDAMLDCDLRDDRSDLARHLVPQSRYLVDGDGRLMVDAVYRFETLAADVRALTLRVFGEERPLPHRNPSQGRAFSVDDLTPQQIARINDLHAADFALLGYPMRS